MPSTQLITGGSRCRELDSDLKYTKYTLSYKSTFIVTLI